MFRVVLPVRVSDVPVGVSVGVSVDVAVVVVDEVVVVVDNDGISASVPSTVIAPSPAPECAHCDSDTERDCHARRIVSGWRIGDRGVRIDGRSVNHGRVVARYVNNLRACLLHNDHSLRLDGLDFNFLLFRCFQIPVVFGLLAHSLYSFHDLVLLRQEGIS